MPGLIRFRTPSQAWYPTFDGGRGQVSPPAVAMVFHQSRSAAIRLHLWSVGQLTPEAIVEGIARTGDGGGYRWRWLEKVKGQRARAVFFGPDGQLAGAIDARLLPGDPSRWIFFSVGAWPAAKHGSMMVDYDYIVSSVRADR